MTIRPVTREWEHIREYKDTVWREAGKVTERRECQSSVLCVPQDKASGLMLHPPYL